MTTSYELSVHPSPLKEENSLNPELQSILFAIEQRFASQPLNLDGVASVVGYGEISSALRLQAFPDLVVKRLPVFSSVEQAERYLACYRLYLAHLTSAGVQVARHSEWIVEAADHVSLFCIQPAFDASHIGPSALKKANPKKRAELLNRICENIERVFAFNDANSSVTLSLDGQLSNWVLSDVESIYIDTSTPLFRIDGSEQLDYERLLTSTPAWLRPIIRGLFLQDVLDRYYQRRLVYVDLVANLYKEGLADEVSRALSIVNLRLDQPVTESEVRRYYREDKIIWQVFLAFRKIDRWFCRYLWRKPYQFLLPDRVRR